MAKTIILNSSIFTDDQLIDMSRDLCVALNNTGIMEASLHRGDASNSTRGEPITLGAIALSVLTGGTAVAALEVLKSFFERDETLEVTFEQDGRTMKISAKNMTQSEFSGSLQSARTFFDGGDDV